MMMQPSAMAARLAPSVPGGPSAGLPTTNTEGEEGEEKEGKGEDLRWRGGEQHRSCS